jgi:PEP-CTERM motif
MIYDLTKKLKGKMGMKKRENVFQLKSLFHLVSAAVTIGFYLTPTSSSALTLRLGGKIVNNNSDHDKNGSNNIITVENFKIGNENNNWTVNGTLRFSTEDIGIIGGKESLGGVLLTLSNFTLTANKNNQVSTLPLIAFSHEFDYEFIGRRGRKPTSLTASNVLSGDWISNSKDDVAQLNKTIFAASVRTQSKQFFSLPNLRSQIPPDSLPVAPLREPLAPGSRTLDNTNSRLDNPTLIGSLLNRRLVSGERLPRLAPGETLSLPSSACVVIPDVEASDFKFTVDKGCKVRPVPEPSSVISLLALGVFGGGFLLKRRRKSSSKQ